MRGAWNRWWMRVPIAWTFGVLSIVGGVWLAFVLALRVQGNTSDFAGGSIIHLNPYPTIFLVAVAISAAEIYGRIFDHRMWTTAYLVFFSVFAFVLFSGEVAIIFYLWQMGFPVVIACTLGLLILSTFAGIMATRRYIHAKRKRELTR